MADAVTLQALQATASTGWTLFRVIGVVVVWSAGPEKKRKSSPFIVPDVLRSRGVVGGRKDAKPLSPYPHASPNAVDSARTTSPAVTVSALEATISITCNDATPNDTLADLQSYHADAAVITEFADVFATGRAACAGWKVHRPGQYTGPTGPTNTSAPLLVIGNLRDPATAWPGANETANVLFPGAGLLTYNVSGHTSFVAPSTCLYDYVGAYFRNGTLPPTGTVCQPDAGVQLFGTNATDSGVSRRAVPGLKGRVMWSRPRKALFSL